MARPHRIIPPLTPQDILRFRAKVDVRGLDECWPWQGGKSKGYGTLRLGSQADDSGGVYLAHRIAWVIANKRPIPFDLCVLHHCDNPPCCSPRCLFTGTVADNYADMVQKGRRVVARGERNGQHTHPERTARGERQGSAKLTEQDVRDIRRRYAAGGISTRTLAREYGIGPTQIRRIIHRERWAHVV